ncbi:MAG: hypothetical protein K9K64_02890 [Desulfohalobiaceae bacterium]|nr:hypothetical protein [Desulfohalobiaceae bacterium]
MQIGKWITLVCVAAGLLLAGCSSLPPSRMIRESGGPIDNQPRISDGSGFLSAKQSREVLGTAITEPVSLEEWKRRPFRLKVLEKISVIFDYWF